MIKLEVQQRLTHFYNKLFSLANQVRVRATVIPRSRSLCLSAAFRMRIMANATFPPE